eukprot:5878084-Alexandrium_andersonii.AAC.1
MLRDIHDGNLAATALDGDPSRHGARVPAPLDYEAHARAVLRDAILGELVPMREDVLAVQLPGLAALKEAAALRAVEPLEDANELAAGCLVR